MVAGEDEISFVMRQDQESLSWCIENQIVNINHVYDKNKLAHVIANFIARRFSGKVKTNKKFYHEVDHLFSELRRNKLSHPFISNEIFSADLQSIVKKSLKNCVNTTAAFSLASTVNPIFESALLNIHKVTNQDKYLYVYTQDKSLLSLCIENYLSNANPDYKTDAVAKILAILTSKKYSGKTITTRKSFFNIFYKFYYYIQSRKFYLFDNNQTLSKELRIDLRKALDNCVNVNSTVVTAAQATPIFEGESTAIAEVLDFILVNWPFHPYFSIHSRAGRSLLRRYVDDALKALEGVLRISHDTKSFRDSIRILWMRRARKFFDFNSIHSYMPYRYTFNNPRPHFEGNLNIFLNFYY